MKVMWINWKFYMIILSGKDSFLVFLFPWLIVLIWKMHWPSGKIELSDIMVAVIGPNCRMDRAVMLVVLSGLKAQEAIWTLRFCGQNSKCHKPFMAEPTCRNWRPELTTESGKSSLITWPFSSQDCDIRHPPLHFQLQYRSYNFQVVYR